MLKQLEKIFSTFLFYPDIGHEVPNNYQWFITEENEIIGMAKEELTKKDIAMLSTFLTPYNLKIPIPTEQEQLWRKRINDDFIEDNVVAPYRFVYFSIKKNQIDTTTFKEAIHEFFSRPVPILWENEHEGIIIEEQASIAEETISYEQIIDVLMSDLYVKINFYVGPFLDNLKNVNQHYTSILRTAEVAISYADKSVITYIEAIPFILIEQTDQAFQNKITDVILKEFSVDDEFLHTIKTFIQCNLNISLAAKELYIHRNSLQYRLDKFNEKTGIDVRQFNGAVTVYLALLANMHKGD